MKPDHAPSRSVSVSSSRLMQNCFDGTLTNLSSRFAGKNLRKSCKFRLFTLLCAAFLAVHTPQAWAQTAQNAISAVESTSAQITVSGTVPDEATRSAILLRVKELYAGRAVVDQLSVGSVVAPPNWSAYVQQMLTPALKQVTRGQLSVSGNTVDLTGEVTSEAIRQQLSSDLSKPLPQTFVLKSGLRVAAAQEQNILDTTLANRIIEFEAGSAVLRPSGKLILDEMAAAMARLGAKPVELIGHTDSQGQRKANLDLSLARASSVRAYLIEKGVAQQLLSVSGAGPDKPIASNSNAVGRSRNRRIEFKLS
jgi:OmpA-OmpF porin, OOP family